MATLTLAQIRSMIHDTVEETCTILLSDTYLNIIINQGYKDVAIKGLCYEKKLPKNVLSGSTIISLVGDNVIRTNYLEDSYSGEGMVMINPLAKGHANVDDDRPYYWFQWGNYIVLDPLPSHTYFTVNVFASCMPDTSMINDTDTPANLPPEFHESVFEFSVVPVFIKLKKWKKAVAAYNAYIHGVRMRRQNYIKVTPDHHSDRELPLSVMLVSPQKQGA
jgi:hypothetical protein